MSSDFYTARMLGIIGSAIIAAGVVLYFLAFLFLLSTLLYSYEARPGPYDIPLSTGSSTGFNLGFYVQFPFLSILGWLILMASLYFFSRIYNEDGIFMYAIYSVASIVIGVFVAFFTFILGASSEIYVVVFFAMLAVVILLASCILMGYFIYKSFSLLGEKSGEPQFKIAGAMMFIAAITLFMFIGLIIEAAGAILLALAFHSLKPPTSTQTETTQTPTETSS